MTKNNSRLFPECCWSRDTVARLHRTGRIVVEQHWDHFHEQVVRTSTCMTSFVCWLACSHLRPCATTADPACLQTWLRTDAWTRCGGWGNQRTANENVIKATKDNMYIYYLPFWHHRQSQSRHRHSLQAQSRTALAQYSEARCPADPTSIYALDFANSPSPGFCKRPFLNSKQSSVKMKVAKLTSGNYQT